MVTAQEVAEYFLSLCDADDSITNLKLQKLLYYAQGFNLVLNDEPLFSEKIKAWQYGPVVEEVYHRFKSFGPNGIDTELTVDIDKFTPEQREVLNEVYSVYGQFSAWKLRDMTHSEYPWQSTPQNEEITLDKLSSHFSTLLVS